jgi:isoamylase
METIDLYPTHEHKGFQLRAGRPFPFGATIVAGGVNFSVFSRHATACTLVLFERGEPQPLLEIPFLAGFRIGNVYSMIVFGLDVENIEYGYRMDGPFDPVAGHRFDHSKILLDPYARAVGGRDVWGQEPNWNNNLQYRGRLVLDDFDWAGDRPLEVPMQDLIIYEMHVRGFTQHTSANIKFPGTFAGIREKIPYLKSLGVNCIELLPIFEFDEFDNVRDNPVTGERLLNYWGYSTVGFFAPKSAYAATGKMGMQVDELKALVKKLHAEGIEVILDVVFNHTAEGNAHGPFFSFKGLDNKTYYMLTPGGDYFNFSGTGNTLNCNNPVVRNMVIDCLRYWVAEYHIDGFRFDLASILGRAPNGAPLANPPLLESLAYDPVLGKCKLIAEAWDAGGLYQVGSFPAYGRWAEWNGKYRDCIRKFLKGEPGQVGELASRLVASPDLYTGRGATASVNFITCHDGFSLWDLFSYNSKHNEANGENNSDGSNDNQSWNCGSEGPTDDPHINALRLRQVKNAFAILMLSQGVPMILMGDEVGHTQHGNNNTYCQDNELTWFDWDRLNHKAELLNFVRGIIAFRHEHALLRNRDHLDGQVHHGHVPPTVSWHGLRAWQADWSGESRVLGMLISGEPLKPRGGDYIYAAFNMHWEPHSFQLPHLPVERRWHLVANTAMPAGEDCWPCCAEPELPDQTCVTVTERSVVILVSRPVKLAVTTCTT